MPLDLDDVDDRRRKDFRRANGAPMYVNAEGKNIRASRPSNWGKELDDENALVNWKINKAVAGVARHPDLIAKAVALKDDDKNGWAELREKAINSGRGDVAADIGTAIHAMSERWEDPDDDFDPGQPYTAHLEAYTEELERCGLVSELFEYQVVNEKYNAAGTADRLFRTTRVLITPDGSELPVGTLLVGDLKTGKSLDFSKPGYAVQMAIYAQGRMYNVETDEFMETPEINQRWGILVHQPSDSPICECLWVDLDVGDWGAYLVQQVRWWRSMWRSGEYEMPVINVAYEEPCTTPEPVEDDPQYLAEWSAWLQERINAIGKAGEQAIKYLRVHWPEAVPTPKQGLNRREHLERLSAVLDKTEAEFGLPFVAGNPAAQPPAERTLYGLK